MSYYDSLVKQVRNLLLWADVRQEQGAPVAPEMKRLSRQVAALERKFQAMSPVPRLAKGEPNGLAEIQALRPRGPRMLWPKFDAKVFGDRMAGALLARAAGCTLGAPIEGWAPERMAELAKYLKVSFPLTDYLPDVDNGYRRRYGKDLCIAYTKRAMKYVPVDDDITYTLLGLLILEDYGPGFTTADVGKAWQKYLGGMACTAEKVALVNLDKGVSWKQAGVKDNPFMEWIGADIRSDPWGYAAPGWPEKAAELAYRDAYISHRYNGIYGEMYFSAVIAAAFAVNDPVEALKIGLTEIPTTCRLYEDVQWALQVAPKVGDAKKAYEMVGKRFGPIDGGMSSVHTNNNACLTIWGITIGGKDITRVLGETVAMGYDCDCTAATAGSIVGAVIGAKKIPAKWVKPFHNRIRTYMVGREWFTATDVVKRFAKQAQAVRAGC